MNLLVLALLAQSQAPIPALDRYAAFAKSAPVTRWEMQVSMRGRPTAKVEFLLDRRKSMRFDAQWAGRNYSTVQYLGTQIELDRVDGVYDEARGLPGLVGVQSRISPVPGFAFPGWAFRTDFRTGYKNDVQVIDHGRKTVAGKAADVVEFVQSSEMGKFHEVVSILPSGAPIQISQQVVSPSAPPDARVWTVTSVAKLAAIPASALKLAIPSGYVPYAFEHDNGPLAVGRTFPMNGWSGPSGRANLKTMVGGKRTLLAMLGQDCLPSRRSESALKDLQKRGVRVVRLSDAQNRRRAAGGLYDPAGKKTDELGITATPTFFLVDGGGKITNLWMGYDPDKRTSFEREVLDAIAGKGG